MAVGRAQRRWGRTQPGVLARRRCGLIAMLWREQESLRGVSEAEGGERVEKSEGSCRRGNRSG